MTFTIGCWKMNSLLLLLRKKNGKREVVLQEDDWKDVEIKMISELFVANQVIQ